jgi:hypothetical protein
MNKPKPGFVGSEVKVTMSRQMKESEAWKHAQHLAQVTRQATQITKLSDRLREETGQTYAFTLEKWPIEGTIVGVVVPLDKER